MHNAPKDSPPKAEYGLWQQLQNAKCVLCLFDGVVTGQSLFQEGTRLVFSGTTNNNVASDCKLAVEPGIPKRLWRLLVFAGLICICFLFSLNSLASQKGYNESLVRSAVIFGILRFTDWPESKAPDGLLKLCAYGFSPSSNAISELKSIPKIGRTQVVFEQLDDLNELESCHAIILGASVENVQLKSPTLLICDECSDGYVHESAIRLSKNENRIQFEIDLDRIDEQSLSLSSSLIELASRCQSSNPAIRGCND